MSTRNLTEIFVLLRNNSLQNRQFNDYGEDTALVSATDDPDVQERPIWSNYVEQAMYTCDRINGKMNGLKELHRKAIHRPDFDDSNSQETQIELLSHEIGQLFSVAHRLLGNLRHETTYVTNSTEARLLDGVISSTVYTINRLSMEFRTQQATYLKTLRSREEVSKPYFEIDLSSGGDAEVDWANVELGVGAGAQSMQQLLQLESNVQAVSARERDIETMVRSITDLNELFKDLSAMVVEQGSVLDRIDYSVEQAQITVAQGLRSVQKAAAYHSSNRKMTCILVLASLTLSLSVLLILTKF